VLEDAPRSWSVDQPGEGSSAESYRSAAPRVHLHRNPEKRRREKRKDWCMSWSHPGQELAYGQ